MKNIDETEKILYDTIGNPTTYRNATMSWYGRQLTKYKLDKDTEDDTSDDVTFDFTYDADGLRGSKVKEYYVKNEDGNYVAKSEKTVYQYVGDKLYYEKRGDYQEFYYFYDSYGKLSAIYYNFKSPTTGKSSSAVYFVTTNSQGDVIGLYNNKGVKVAAYEYDAWGNILSVKDSTGKTITNQDHIANANPFRYRGYYYDADLGLYYVSSRYYDPEIGRWINADNQLSTGSDLTGMNLFAYCGNNPVNRIDPTGEAWWHWALGAAVVAVAAVATVVTCGGFAAAATAVCMVGSGVAAATTASTVAAGAFIGSATVYGMAVLSAASTSNSVQEFNDQGNWGTVAATAFGGLTGGYDGYTMSKAQTPTSTPTGKGTQNPKVKAAVQKGQAMHKQMDYGPGVLKEQTIAPGCRVDGIDFNNRIIYELKPNNPQAIARGMSQLNRYTSAASQQFGGTWTGVLKLYD